MNDNYLRLMNDSLKQFLRKALRISFANPKIAWFLLKTLSRQKKAAQRRLVWESRGVHVPPYLIVSITEHCNLKCPGCYAQAHQRNPDRQLSLPRWREIFNEARTLGISVILIAGGEPFTRREFLNLTKMFPDIIFPVFTNGLLLNEELIKELKNQKNTVPIISIEGFAKETDARRGVGTFAHLQKIIPEFDRQGLFFGVSITVTKENFSTVTDQAFIRTFLNGGCKVFVFVEYTPIDPGTENLILTDNQRSCLSELMRKFQSESKGLFVSFPGDEAMYGGCLAAGRGFVHISSDGNLEPCPFAPYSDINLNDKSLQEALQSEFLKEIRQNHHNLIETAGGCALWTQREWVLSLLGPKKVQPTRSR